MKTVMDFIIRNFMELAMAAVEADRIHPGAMEALGGGATIGSLGSFKLG